MRANITNHGAISRAERARRSAEENSTSRHLAMPLTVTGDAVGTVVELAFTKKTRAH
jgi:hypothetical protein